MRPTAAAAKIIAPARFIDAALIALLAADQLLLWRFLGGLPLAAYFVAAVCVALTTYNVGASRSKRELGPTLSEIALCFLVALTILLLGGEGGLLHTTPTGKCETQSCVT